MKKWIRNIGCVITLSLSFASFAEEWPSRPIRYVMPFQGLPDTIARAYNEHVSQILKQPIVPEYKLGVAGRLALGEIERSKPDGYTIGMATSGPLTIHPNLYSKLPYDPDTSFAILSILGMSPMALAVPASSPVKTLNDLQELSKTRELNIAATGVGGPHHLAAVLLQQIGVKALIVQFKSSADIMSAMMGGAIDAYFDTVYQHSVFVQEGRYRALGVTSAQRMPQMPDVPTFVELGYPELDIQTFYATVAPAQTPQPILDELTTAYASAARSPEVQELLKRMALLGVDKSRSELETIARDARARWKQVIEQNNIKVE